MAASMEQNLLSRFKHLALRFPLYELLEAVALPAKPPWWSLVPLAEPKAKR